MAAWNDQQKDKASQALRELGVTVVSFDSGGTVFRPVTILHLLNPTPEAIRLIQQLDEQFDKENGANASNKQ